MQNTTTAQVINHDCIVVARCLRRFIAHRGRQCDGAAALLDVFFSPDRIARLNLKLDSEDDLGVKVKATRECRQFLFDLSSKVEPPRTHSDHARWESIAYIRGTSEMYTSRCGLIIDLCEQVLTSGVAYL